MTLIRFVKLGLGLVLSVFFGWLIIRQVNFGEVQTLIFQANFLWICLAIVGLALGYACRTIRWQIMLKQANPNIGFFQTLGPLIASFALNNVLPLRAGDILRAFAFKAELGVAPGPVIATLILERLLDLLTLLLLLAIALLLSKSRYPNLFGIVVLLVALIGTLLATALLFPHQIVMFGKTVARTLTARLPQLFEKITVKLNSVSDFLTTFSMKDCLPKLLIWTVAAWLCEMGVFYCVAKALPSLTAPHASLFALPVGTMATLIPSTPGYVGTFDFFVIQVMIENDNSAVAAATFALAVHIVLWLPITFFGGLFLTSRAIGKKAFT